MSYYYKKRHYSEPTICTYKNNQVVYHTKIKDLFLEVRFWKGCYELYTRVKSKTMGFYICTFFELQPAINYCDYLKEQKNLNNLKKVKLFNNSFYSKSKSKS